MSESLEVSLLSLLLGNSEIFEFESDGGSFIALIEMLKVSEIKYCLFAFKGKSNDISETEGCS
jgi:hypothetical protein